MLLTVSEPVTCPSRRLIEAVVVVIDGVKTATEEVTVEPLIVVNLAVEPVTVEAITVVILPTEAVRSVNCADDALILLLVICEPVTYSMLPVNVKLAEPVKVPVAPSLN